MIFAAQAPTMKWETFNATVFLSLYSLCAYGEAWRPLLKRWSKDDHSIMQPAEPSALPLVFLTLTKATMDIGDREKTLIGASSFNSGTVGAVINNALAEAQAAGET